MATHSGCAFIAVEMSRVHQQPGKDTAQVSCPFLLTELSFSPFLSSAEAYQDSPQNNHNSVTLLFNEALGKAGGWGKVQSSHRVAAGCNVGLSEEQLSIKSF